MRTIEKLQTCIIALLFALSALTARASGQVPEILMWDGGEYHLLDLPLYLNKDLAEAFIDKYGITSPHTANIRGYQGYWSIKDGELYLDSIRCNMQKITIMGQDTIIGAIEERTLIAADEAIFAPHKTEKGVKATWVTETLRVANGDVIRYIHLGFMRTYEHEVAMQFTEGKLTRTIHTRYSKEEDGSLMIHNEELERYIVGKRPKCKGTAKIKISIHDDEDDEPLIATDTCYINRSIKRTEVVGVSCSENCLCTYNINPYLLKSEPAYMEIRFDKRGTDKVLLQKIGNKSKE